MEFQYFYSWITSTAWETVSPALTTLAKSLWLWALERDIFRTAHHVPEVSNVIEDLQFRLQKDRSDWILAHEVFQRTNQAFGPLEVDLFTARVTHQLPHFFRPLAEAVNALQQDRSSMKGHINPPWCLIARVLNQVRIQEAQVILVAPAWKG